MGPTVCLVGYGYWGPNLLRNLLKVGFHVVAVCDTDPERLARVPRQYPGVRTSTEPNRWIQGDEAACVVIATPTATHYDLASRSLGAGKHVLVEKPLAATVAQAEHLVELAASVGRVLAVDHTFVYAPPVRRLREAVRSGELGEVLYVDSTRINLGLFQSDVNVVWDLGPHDFSILDYVLNRPARTVRAFGYSPVKGASIRESLAYIQVDYGDSLAAHFTLSWVSPVKIRRTIVAGSERMAVYDHLDADAQIKIYDSGVAVRDADPYRVLISYRLGDVLVPKLDSTEPLEIECQAFLNAIRGDGQLLADGEAGLRVVRLLDAAQRSITNDGTVVSLQ